MPAYLKKMSFLFISLLFLFSCALEKAEKEYQKGNYLKSVEIVFEYLDKKPENISKLKPKVKTELSEKFSNILSHYKRLSAENGRMDEQIEGNLSLFAIYSMIESRNYSTEFPELKKFVSESNIESFYNGGKNAINHVFNGYLKENNENEAIKYLNYIDRFTSYAEKAQRINPSLENQDKYTFIIKDSLKEKAEGYIGLAEKNEGRENYRNAQKFYLTASETYSKYERNYKNSYTKYLENKNKADLKDAERHYEAGIRAMKDTRSVKQKYRIAYKEFKNAQKYVPSYKDTDRLLRETYEMGIIKYKVSSNNSDYTRIITNAMTSIGTQNFSGIPDITIEYYEDSSDYNVINHQNHTESHKEKIEVGKDTLGNPIYEDYHYKKNISSKTEVIKVRFTISVKGNFYNDRITDYVVYENPIKEIFYAGRIPPGYSNQTSGYILGKYEMRRKVDNDIKNAITKAVNNMVRELEKY